ncbi:reverse transcriptase domain-containing protein [Tanacetum coccineum]
MDQKVLTITERQAEQKRKLEFNAGNNQGHQQQNKRQNTGRAYTTGPSEKMEYMGLLPLCTKCNYHHKGPCAPRCNKCKKISHLARDCRSSGPNDCPKLKNGNRANQRGNGNAPARVYLVGNAGTNSESNVVMDPESNQWLDAINAEMQSIKDNQVWRLVDLPSDAKTIGSKLLFKKKIDMDCNIHTYKARIIANDYTQTYEIDYEENDSQREAMPGRQMGKRCEKNYSSVRRYVADPDNAYPKRSITKLILKGAVIFDVVSYQFRCALNYSKLLLKLLNQEYVARIRGKLIQKLLLNQKCMGYLVRAYYSISPTKYYKDDSCWSADLKSNTTEDVISI